jgi:hypothetical protein
VADPLAPSAGHEEQLIALRRRQGARRQQRLSALPQDAGRQAFEIDEKRVAEDARYDRLYILRTNLHLDALDVMLRYPELLKVEDISRTAKSILDTRPIYHQTDEPSAATYSARSSRSSCARPWKTVAALTPRFPWTRPAAITGPAQPPRRWPGGYGRRRDADGLEDAADVTGDRRAQYELLVVLLGFDFLQAVELPDQRAHSGFKCAAHRGHTHNYLISKRFVADGVKVLVRPTAPVFHRMVGLIPRLKTRGIGFVNFL